MAHMDLDQRIPAWVALFDSRCIMPADLKVKAACNAFLIAVHFGENKSNAPSIVAHMPEIAMIADLLLELQAEPSPEGPH